MDCCTPTMCGEGYFPHKHHGLLYTHDVRGDRICVYVYVYLCNVCVGGAGGEGAGAGVVREFVYMHVTMDVRIY